MLPTGYAFNLDGTSIYISLYVLFIANAYGVPLSWEQQLGIIAIMLVTSKGGAAVSDGSFVVFTATVTVVGVLPVEGLALLFGVYRFMSMAIATCNMIGNSVATVIVLNSPANSTSRRHATNITRYSVDSWRQSCRKKVASYLAISDNWFYGKLILAEKSDLPHFPRLESNLYMQPIKADY